MDRPGEQRNLRLAGQHVKGREDSVGKYTQWIAHKGKRMLLVNGPGLSEAQYLEAMEEMKLEILKERVGTLVLVNVSGIEMTKAVINKSKEVVNATKEAGIPDRPNVVVGLNKLQKAVAQLFGRGVHFVDTVEQGKEWLAKEDDKGR
jgi:hypothetical protein